MQPVQNGVPHGAVNVSRHLAGQLLLGQPLNQLPRSLLLLGQLGYDSASASVLQLSK